MALTAVRIVLAAAGAAMLVLFAVPVPLGIVNIGSVTGLMLSAAAIAAGVFLPRIAAAVQSLGRTASGRSVIGAVLAFFLAVAALAAVTAVCMARAARPAGPDPQGLEGPGQPDVLIVLGAQVRGTKPSLMLAERLMAAYEYLEAHPESICVVSGGQGPEEEITEADCMADWLIARGVSPGRILREDRSVSTEENLLFSAQVLAENGLPLSARIVTNEFHMYRGRWYAAKAGILAGSLPAGTAFWLLPTFAVREQYALLYAWLKG